MMSFRKYKSRATGPESKQEKEEIKSQKGALDKTAV
jgi:hypothetical protein